jgi:transcriptional regulator
MEATHANDSEHDQDDWSLDQIDQDTFDALAEQAVDQDTFDAIAEPIIDRTLITPSRARTYVRARSGYTQAEIARQRDLTRTTTHLALEDIEDIYARARTLVDLADDDPSGDEEPEYPDLWDAGASTIAEHTPLTEPQAIVWVEKKQVRRIGWYPPAAEGLADLADDDTPRTRSTVNDHLSAAKDKIERAQATVELIELDNLFTDVNAATDVDDLDDADTTD